MAKEWKDRQKAVDKIEIPFDEFCDQLEISKEDWLAAKGTSDELKLLGYDPLLAYAVEMKSRLESYGI